MQNSTILILVISIPLALAFFINSIMITGYLTRRNVQEMIVINQLEIDTKNAELRIRDAKFKFEEQMICLEAGGSPQLYGYKFKGCEK